MKSTRHLIISFLKLKADLYLLAVLGNCETYQITANDKIPAKKVECNISQNCIRHQYVF